MYKPFCKCGAPTRLKGKKYFCLKTEKNIKTCNGIFVDGNIVFKKHYEVNDID